VQITGSYPESANKFTGTVGPWGIQYPDLYFGVREADGAATPPTINRFVWNDKADSTGLDMMNLTENSVLTLEQRRELFASPRLSLARSPTSAAAA
jgi:hypothetical protein